MSDSRLSPRVLRGALAALLAVSLSACGSSGGGEVVDLGTGSTGSPAPIPASGEPTEGQAIIVPTFAFEYGYQMIAPTAAGTYTFELTNDGDMEHDLVIEGEGVSGGTEIVGPGESDSFTVELEPGTYTVYCSVGTHRSQGMEVTFTVG